MCLWRGTGTRARGAPRLGGESCCGTKPSLITFHPHLTLSHLFIIQIHTCSNAGACTYPGRQDALLAFQRALYNGSLLLYDPFPGGPLVLDTLNTYLALQVHKCGCTGRCPGSGACLLGMRRGAPNEWSPEQSVL